MQAVSSPIFGRGGIQGGAGEVLNPGTTKKNSQTPVSYLINNQPGRFDVDVKDSQAGDQVTIGNFPLQGHEGRYSRIHTDQGDKIHLENEFQFSGVMMDAETGEQTRVYSNKYHNAEVRVFGDADVDIDGALQPAEGQLIPVSSGQPAIQNPGGAGTGGL
jgi:hypothetical protein